MSVTCTEIHRIFATGSCTDFQGCSKAVATTVYLSTSPSHRMADDHGYMYIHRLHSGLLACCKDSAKRIELSLLMQECTTMHMHTYYKSHRSLCLCSTMSAYTETDKARVMYIARMCMCTTQGLQPQTRSRLCQPFNCHCLTNKC